MYEELCIPSAGIGDSYIHVVMYMLSMSYVYIGTLGTDQNTRLRRAQAGLQSFRADIYTLFR